MYYKVTWDTPGKVLGLKLIDAVPFEAFIEINSQINERLQECNQRIILIIDASDAKVAPYYSEGMARHAPECVNSNTTPEKTLVIRDSPILARNPQATVRQNLLRPSTARKGYRCCHSYCRFQPYPPCRCVPRPDNRQNA